MKKTKEGNSIPLLSFINLEIGRVQKRSQIYEIGNTFLILNICKNIYNYYTMLYDKISILPTICVI